MIGGPAPAGLGRANYGNKFKWQWPVTGTVGAIAKFTTFESLTRLHHEA